MSEKTQSEALQVHPISLDLQFRNVSANIDAIESAIRMDTSRSDRSIFVFPELTLTGFVTLNPQAVALSKESPALMRLCEVAKRYRVAIIAGFIEAPTEPSKKPSNTTLFISRDGAIIGRYKKIHLFTKGRPSEAETFEAGETPLLVEYLGHRVAIGVCFDIRFPSLFQFYARNGADLLIVIACWVSGENKSVQFQTLTRAHAITSRAYMVAVNRKGSDPHFSYDGENLAYDPAGAAIEARPMIVDRSRIDAVRSYVEIDYARAFREGGR